MTSNFEQYPKEQEMEGETITLKYKTVGYGKLISLGNFENERLYLEAEVPEGATLEQVVSALRHQIDIQLVQPQKAYKNLERLNEEIAWKERRLAQLGSECEQLNQNLRLTKAANHIEEDVPF